ncbi:leucine-rich repeat-containing protein 61 isoform X2 [Pelodiscus sinensis]|uniref:leucine-rich repeat-containing protein 61 isoform X2 n=1 Tax=Pelodiscus sinensis TaxID=13735 RepID=UPI003F6CE501
MEPRAEQGPEGEAGRVTAQLLKAKTGEFALDSILLLKLPGLGLWDLGCLGECASLEWLDLSGNGLSQLGPLAGLRYLAVLDVSANRLSSLEPLGACESLQRLNAAGNLLGSLPQLQGLAGLRRLESLRLHDARARLSNPLCASPAYPAALLGLLPGLRALDGQRVCGRGSELRQLCRDLDRSLERGAGGAGGAEPPGAALPWLEEGYWERRPARRGSVAEEAYRQFGEALRECRELGQRADNAIAQAERALGAPGSYVF